MDDNSKQPTINDVARLSGVSKRTVSRVLNNSPKVNAQTRKTIHAVIKDLDFKPNRHARGLAGKKSYLVGMIYDNLDALFMDDTQRGLIEIFSKVGYELIIHPCSYTSETLLEDIHDFVGRAQVDGVVILPPVSELNHLTDNLQKTGLPYVRIASVKQDKIENIIVSKDRDAVFALTQKLISLGHSKIGFIAGPAHYFSSQERLSGFHEAIDKSGHAIKAEWITHGDYSFDSGHEAGLKLMKLQDRPTAIIASNDIMAIGAMHAVDELGFSVPEDVSIAGFDDNLIASKVLPPLTTIRRPVRRMAEQAAHKLLAQISDEKQSDAAQETFFTPELVIRRSTRDIS